MAKVKTPLSAVYLLKGAVYALEQSGILLRDANSLYGSGSYGSAVALAAFAREELGRMKILFDNRAKVLAGETVTTEQIRESCNDHITKQERAVVATVIRTDRDSVMGKRLQTRAQAHPQSEEWKAADKELKKIDEIQRSRAPRDRHQQRIRGMYVDPDETGRGWNRPRDVGQKAAYEFLTNATNDYANRLQMVDPELLKGSDDQLLQQLTDWTDRPALPLPEWLPLPGAA